MVLSKQQYFSHLNCPHVWAPKYVVYQGITYDTIWSIILGIQWQHNPEGYHSPILQRVIGKQVFGLNQPITGSMVIEEYLTFWDKILIICLFFVVINIIFLLHELILLVFEQGLEWDPVLNVDWFFYLNKQIM